MRGAEAVHIIPSSLLILIGLAVAAVVVGVVLSALFAYEFDGDTPPEGLHALAPLPPPLRWEHGEFDPAQTHAVVTRNAWDRMCGDLWELLVAGEINWTEPIRPGSVGFYDQEVENGIA